VGFTYYKLVLKNLFIFLISSMAFMQFNRRKFIFILITNGILISFLIINDWVNHLHLLNNATYFYRSSSILGNPNIAGLTICFFSIPIIYMLFKSFNVQYF